MLIILADPEKDNIDKIYEELEQLRKEIPWIEPKDEESIQEHYKKHTNTSFLIITKRVYLIVKNSIYLNSSLIMRINQWLGMKNVKRLMPLMSI